MPETLNILFLAAEAYPFVKVGGLADVAGALPFALRSLSPRQTGGNRLDVRLVLPLHRMIQSDVVTMKPLTNFKIPTDDGYKEVQAYEATLNGVPTYFIDGLPISQSDSVYSTNPEQDREKYTFFSLAALELVRVLNWRVNIIHANDWHTALCLYALRTCSDDPFYSTTAGLITVHNLPYMGGDSGDLLTMYGLKELVDKDMPIWARKQALPLGLWAADGIVPVSETYAREILTPEYGCGLQEFLRNRTDNITGVINGLDINLWDPASDEYLFSNYDLETLEARDKNKISLVKKVELDFNPQVPLIGMVSRIDYQKGIDLTIRALRTLNDMHWQFVILGTGDAVIEAELSQLQAEYPDRVRVILRYDTEMSHLIYAGSDIFLMPSRYEPCGLSQMIAMRYGSVPLVHATGGLKDTVHEGKTGFVFDKSDPEIQAEAMRRAFKVFAAPIKWRSFQRSGMKQDFSWTQSARKYAIIYRSIAFKYILGGEQ
jgi:starch synthase